MMVVGMNGAMNCSSLYRLASELTQNHRQDKCVIQCLFRVSYVRTWPVSFASVVVGNLRAVNPGVNANLYDALRQVQPAGFTPCI